MPSWTRNEGPTRATCMQQFETLERDYGLQGKYRVEAVLARGGMGVVLRAVQLSLGRHVALKILLASVRNAEMVRHFLGEADVAARISHPNVAKLFDAGQGEGGFWIAYELIDGISLRKRMATELPALEALELAAQAAQGLEAIHAAGAIHRDIKPDNILVEPTGLLKLIDLGLAKNLFSEQTTAEGIVMGTPPYMALEQHQGKPVTPAADIYSLGVVLYEMLTGKLPFATVAREELRMALQTRRPEPPSHLNSRLDPRWDELVLKALEKDPAERYPSAKAFAEALEAACRLGVAPPVATGSTLEAALPAGRAGAASRSGGRRQPSSRPATGMPGTQITAPGVRNRRPQVVVFGSILLLAALGGLYRLRSPAAVVGAQPGQKGEQGLGPQVSTGMDGLPAGAGNGRPADPLERQLQQTMADDRSLPAQYWCAAGPEKTGTVPPAGLRRFRCRVLVVDAASVKQPRLELHQLRPTPAGAGQSPPRAWSMPGVAGRERLLAMQRPDPRPGRWQAGLPDGWLQEGYNELELELDTAGRDEPGDWEVRLTLERSAGFPRASLALPRTDGSATCPTAGQLAASWELYRTGRLGEAEERARKALVDNPLCGAAMLQRALALMRIWQERRKTGDSFSTLMMSEVVMKLGALGEMPLPVLQRETHGQFATLLRTYPRWPVAWQKLAERLRVGGETEQALRCGRWAVLLEPRAGAFWVDLADSEMRLLPAKPPAPQSWEARKVRDALSHVDRGFEMLAACPEGLSPAAHYVRGRLQILAGRRGDGRESFEAALALNPAMLEARRGLEELDRSASWKH